MTVVGSHVPINTGDWLLSHGIRIALVIVGALVILLVARIAVRRMQRRLEGAETTTQELDLQRAATLTQAITYVVRVGVWTVAILIALGEFGISLGPLLAGAGIVGVALGFGAQALVRDFLSGFFILLENQFGVGDSIDILVTGETVNGRVEALSLRITQLRDFDGTLRTIPNGNIILVGNRSRGWARAIIDVGVAYGEDVDRVRGVLEELFEEIRDDRKLQGWFFDGPRVLGVERLGEKDVVLRVVADTRPTKRGDLERELRVRIKERFEDRGIKVPATA